MRMVPKGLWVSRLHIRAQQQISISADLPEIGIHINLAVQSCRKLLVQNWSLCQRTALEIQCRCFLLLPTCWHAHTRGYSPFGVRAQMSAGCWDNSTSAAGPLSSFRNASNSSAWSLHQAVRPD